MSDNEVLAYAIVPTGASNRKAAEKAWRDAMEKAGLKKVDYLVATGYGRDSVDFADASVTEITCHARGAHYIFPDARTVIDIGGQDSKIIRVNEMGRTEDFVMNDKCAAGTGRFLEVMAKALEVKLEEMGPLSLESVNEIKVSSTCTVFAESEVVSLVAAGHETRDILQGIHRAIAGRVAALVSRVGLAPCVIMSGGVAKNVGVVRALEEKLDHKITVPPEPQIIGAIGAAIIAALKFGENRIN
jgi:predicted CoA-substrate-specific enzyme activase